MINTTKLALKVCGMYLIVGVLWILFSDAALSLLTSDIRWYTRVGILKGWFFIIVTCGVLYFFLKKWAAGFVQDVVKRRQAEETLAESEASLLKLSMAVEQTGDSVVITDRDGLIEYVNPAFENTTGYSKDLVIGGTLRILKSGKQSHEYYKTLWQTILGGKVFRDVVVNKKKNGDLFHEEQTITPIVDGTGEIIHFVSTGRDITESKRAEVALRESQNRLRLFFSQSLDGFYFSLLDEPKEWSEQTDKEAVLDYVFSHQRITEVNDAMLAQYGATREKFLGRPLGEFFRHDPALGRDLRQKLFDEGHLHVETGELKEDGTPIWIDGDYVCMYDEDHRIVGTFGIQRDVTERKRVEEDLRASEARYRAVLNSANDAIVSTDTNWVVAGWNNGAKQTFGYKYTEAIGQPISALIPKFQHVGNPRASVPRSGTDVIAGGNITELMGVRKDGTEFPLELSLSEWRIDEGQFFTLIIRDITRRKRAEQDLFESTERFRQLTDAIREVFWLSDPKNGEILYISRGYDEIWGRTRESLLANPMSWAESIHPDDRSRVVQNATAGQVLGTYDEEYRIVRPDGTIRWIHDQAFPVNDQNGEVSRVARIAEDITGRKSLEHQLRQAQKLESLGTLAGGIAHDFNNILGIIMGHASLLGRQGSDHDKLLRSTEAITKASQRGAGLVRQLLTFARKTDALLESVRVNDIIVEITKLLEETFPKTITISLILDRSLPGIIADSNQLHQTILNLCVNARDAMPEGGTLEIMTSVLPSNAIQSEFANAGPGKYVCTSISDTGTGMDEGTRQRIFEPFFTTKGVGKGTGLGLAVVYGIVNSLNGYVSVESSPGKGTTFRLYFPILEHDHLGFETIAVEPGGIPAGTETILVVEDEEMLMDLIATLLQANGYGVLRAKDGEEAVDVYKRNMDSIALVITDLGLPKCDGFNAFLRMKTLNPRIKAIIASGYIRPEQRSEIFLSGVREIIIKPYVPAQVIRLIREVIDHKVDTPDPGVSPVVPFSRP